MTSHFEQALAAAVAQLPEEQQRLARLALRSDLQDIARTLGEGRPVRQLLLLAVFATLLDRHREEMAKIHDQREIVLVVADENTNAVTCCALPATMREELFASWPAARAWLGRMDWRETRVLVRLKKLLVRPVLLNASEGTWLFSLEPGTYEGGAPCRD